MIGPSRAGPHDLLIPSGRGASTWVDLQTLTTRPGPVLDLQSFIGASPSGARAMTVVREVAVMTVGGTDAEVVARDVRNATFADDHRIVVLGRDGHVALHDLDRHTATPLAAAGARNIHAAGDVITIGYDDDHYERIALATGRREELRPPARAALNQITGDGRLWLAWGDQLSRWELDGRLVPCATAPGKITDLFVTGERGLVIDTAEAGFVVDTARPGALRRTVRLGAVELSPDVFDRRATQAGEYLAVPRSTGGVVIVDGLTGAAWQVGQDQGRGAAKPSIDRPEIALDGSAVYELRDRTLAVWPLAIARSPAATVALAAALSNAVPNDTGDAVSWP
jgi:hypothetical protein